MELINKRLIKNEAEAQSLIDDWKSQRIFSFLGIKDFEEYPALVCYYIDESDYSLSHKASAYYSLTYLSDFEEE